MVRYLNPGGHNYAAENFDGYGISLIVVIVLYSIFFYAACAFLWLQRNDPAIRMRKIPLALLSILVLHVYLIMPFIVYPINGSFPCGLEFWIMSIYLPIGIGLFQAQNQQLLIVSREQNLLKGIDELYRPLYPNHGGGIGGPKYWIWRLKLWWRSVNTQNKYEGLVLIGMVVQVRRLAPGQASDSSQCSRAWSNQKLISNVLVRCFVNNILRISPISRLWCGITPYITWHVSSRMGVVRPIFFHSG